ncbi:MAG: hypothetical protein ABID38_06150 [Candidatus Diapherotrites archaeon]
MEDEMQGGSSGFPSKEQKDLIVKGLIVVGIVAVLAVIVFAIIIFLNFDMLPREQPINMLIIGASSQEVIDVLDKNNDLLDYRIKTAESLDRNPEAQLEIYDIVMLDQSEQANKEISRQLGEALADYVNAGGNLIVVKNSGIRRPGASDVIGWEAAMGNTVPVRCDLQLDNRPVCDEASKIFVRGRILRKDESHPIMNGIEQAPADPNSFLYLDTFDVGQGDNYKEIAYMEDSATGKTFPAIVERVSLLGKSIYFNYNPGKTQGIFENTLEYLR